MNQTLQYAIDSYSFILPTGKHSFKQWAALIKKHYDISNPRNRAVYNVVINTNGEINKTRSRMNLKIFSTYR